MMTKQLPAWLCLLLLSSLSLSACVDEGNNSISSGGGAAVSHIDIGRQFLIDNRYRDASKAFADSLAEDGDSNEARYGKIIADFGELTDTAQIAFSLAMLVVGDLSVRTNPEGSKLALQSYQDENAQVTGLILDIFRTFAVPARKLYQDIEELKKRENPTFEIDNFKMHVLGQDLLHMSGEWDASDLLWLSAFNGMIGGICLAAGSLDWRFDLFDGFDGATELVSGDGISVDGVLNLLVSVLNDPNYNFLGRSQDDLDKDGVPDGDTWGVYAADMLGTMFADIAAMPAALAAESDPQGNDILVALELEDDSAPLSVGLSGRIKVDEGLGTIQWFREGVLGDFVLLLDEESLAGYQRFGENLLAEPGDSELVILGDHVAPVLGSIVATVLKAIYLGDTIASVTTILGNSPSSISSVLVGIVPADSLALSPSHALRGEGELRGMLPAYRDDLPADQVSFILEWECADLIPADAVYGSTNYHPGDGYTCDDEATLTDAGHFGSAGVPIIGNDGLESPLPYIAFRDASFGNSIYINSSTMDLENATNSFEPATNHSLNGLIAFGYDHLPF